MFVIGENDNRRYVYLGYGKFRNKKGIWYYEMDLDLPKGWLKRFKCFKEPLTLTNIKEVDKKISEFKWKENKRSYILKLKLI